MGELRSELVENQIWVAQGWVVSAAGVAMLAQRPCSEACHSLHRDHAYPWAC